MGGGRSYSFCQTCDDLQDHCPHGVQSSSECDFGASLEPPLLPVDTVAEQEEWCAGQCQAQGHCCNDPSTGSNQMISCAQACMMRASGEKMVDMLSDHDGICDRTGSSGCDLDVGGRSYSFCQTCDDLQDHCPHGVQSSSECDFGASLGCAGLYEAEDANMNGGEVVANHAGFTGSGYYNPVDTVDDSVEWTLPGCAPGATTLSFRYALSSGSRPTRVFVNNVEVETSFEMPATGNWGSYGDVTLSVTLRPGQNTVKMQVGASSAPNIDSLTVQ